MADNPKQTLTADRERLIREGFCFDSDRDCTVARELLAEIDALRAALKQPRTQWQARITREQARDLMYFYSLFNYKLIGANAPLKDFVSRLRELGIEVLPEPPEASR